MPRIVTNALLHTIFSPKEFSSDTFILIDNYCTKFLDSKKNYPDGISFDETFLGHGRLIFKHSKQIFEERRKKKPCNYKSFGYILADPNTLLTEILIPEHVKNRFGGSFFKIIPDENTKIHVLICLPENVKSSKYKNSLIALLYNNEILCNENELSGILFELNHYFNKNILSIEQCYQHNFFLIV
jgi:hypothetical protein